MLNWSVKVNNNNDNNDNNRGKVVKTNKLVMDETRRATYPCVYNFSAIFIVSFAEIRSFLEANFSSSCR